MTWPLEGQTRISGSGMPVGRMTCSAVTPPERLLSNGLGVAETFYVAFLTPAGAAASEILALAVVARLIPMILSLPGVVVAVRGPKLPTAEKVQAELLPAD